MDAFAALMGGRAAPRADGEDPNLLFYKGELASEPEGAKVDEIHRSWRGDFRRLELHHGYIQWLFPVFENAGMNWRSSPLTKEGAATIRASEACSRRVLESYRLMLHFYGLVLVDAKTGAVARDPDAAHAAERLENLHERAHNWLRISRIITSLGELGFARYKKPLVAALRKEVEAGTLADAAESCERYWAPLAEDEGAAWYNRKTREVDADRAEGCLFAAGAELGGAPAPAPPAAAEPAAAPPPA